MMDCRNTHNRLVSLALAARLDRLGEADRLAVPRDRELHAALTRALAAVRLYPRRIASEEDAMKLDGVDAAVLDIIRPVLKQQQQQQQQSASFSRSAPSGSNATVARARGSHYASPGGGNPGILAGSGRGMAVTTGATAGGYNAAAGFSSASRAPSLTPPPRTSPGDLLLNRMAAAFSSAWGAAGSGLPSPLPAAAAPAIVSRSGGGGARAPANTLSTAVSSPPPMTVTVPVPVQQGQSAPAVISTPPASEVVVIDSDDEGGHVAATLARGGGTGTSPRQGAGSSDAHRDEGGGSDDDPVIVSASEFEASQRGRHSAGDDSASAADERSGALLRPAEDELWGVSLRERLLKRSMSGVSSISAMSAVSAASAGSVATSASRAASTASAVSVLGHAHGGAAASAAGRPAVGLSASESRGASVVSVVTKSAFAADVRATASAAASTSSVAVGAAISLAVTAAACSSTSDAARSKHLVGVSALSRTSSSVGAASSASASTAAAGSASVSSAASAAPAGGSVLARSHSLVAAQAVEKKRRAALGSAGDAWECPQCLREFAFDEEAKAWRISSLGVRGDVRAAFGCAADQSGGAFSAAENIGSHTSNGHVCSLDAANWEVVMLVDNREIRTRDDRTYLASQLMGKGIPCEVRTLPLGDVLWVLRRRTGSLLPPTLPAALQAAVTARAAATATAAAASPPAAKGKRKAAAMACECDEMDGGDEAGSAAAPKKRGPKKQRTTATKSFVLPGPGPVHVSPPNPEREYVLDFIVERKAVGDLASSIIDGRYNEQKLRLSDAGLRVTYLIEGDPNRMHESNYNGMKVGPKHIAGAMTTTQIMHGFRVVNTHNIDATIGWLSRMHAAVVNEVMNVSSACQCVPPGTALLAAATAAGAAVSSTALSMSQAAAGAYGAAATGAGSSFAELGGGGGGASSSSATTTQYHLCRNDKCNLWGRPGLPRLVLNFNEFKVVAAKPRILPALQLFGMMLRQVNGCSADRAQAILDNYPTPAALRDAYASMPDERRGRDMLRGLPVPNQRNTLGPALSASIYNLVMSKDYVKAGEVKE